MLVYLIYACLVYIGDPGCVRSLFLMYTRLYKIKRFIVCLSEYVSGITTSGDDKEKNNYMIRASVDL